MAHFFSKLQGSPVKRNPKHSPTTDFAIGNPAVFYSVGGGPWTGLLSSLAIPSHPMAGFFDEDNRSFYVAMNGREVIRYDHIPTSWLIEAVNTNILPFMYKNLSFVNVYY